MRAILFFLLFLIFSSCGLENGVERGYIISEGEKTENPAENISDPSNNSRF